MTAALVNTLAGLIYAVCHPDVELKPKAPTVEGEDFDPYFYRINQPYIDFYHPDYQAFRRYPFGLFNMVGYWAEAELFGGVLLFDRGESGLEVGWHCRELCLDVTAMLVGYALTDIRSMTPSYIH